jgi:hypothetical protein
MRRIGKSRVGESRVEGRRMRGRGRSRESRSRESGVGGSTRSYATSAPPFVRERGLGGMGTDPVSSCAGMGTDPVSSCAGMGKRQSAVRESSRSRRPASRSRPIGRCGLVLLRRSTSRSACTLLTTTFHNRDVMNFQRPPPDFPNFTNSSSNLPLLCSPTLDSRLPDSRLPPVASGFPGSSPASRWR